MKKTITFSAVLLVLSACANISQSGSQNKVSYNCDEGSFWVAYSKDGKVANLNIDVESIHLDLIPHDTFKEYSDQTTTFWPEGKNNVYIRQDLANLYHNCIKG